MRRTRNGCASCATARMWKCGWTNAEAQCRVSRVRCLVKGAEAVNPVSLDTRQSIPNAPPLIVVTAGEPAGIGPDLCVMLARHPLAARIVVVADRDVLAARARALGVDVEFVDYTAHPPRTPAGSLTVLHLPVATPVVGGKLDPANSRYVLRTLEVACDGCLDGTFDAMATAPVHKGVINDAGIPFTGHTEFLEERTRSKRVVMMLVGGGMRVALATTHLALRDVPAAITRETVSDALRILDADLRRRFGIARPRVLVAGLNPHAGESGHLGREEIDVIAPVL